MWEFRKDPKELSRQDKHKLDELFSKVPGLRTLYEFRRRFQRIFDTAQQRQRAHQRLLGLFFDMMDTFPELTSFIRTFEHWQEEILNYFEARQTSGPVEGVNNKARVILKRAYGLKSADSLWTRLILDLNRAKEIVLYTIRQIRELVRGLRAMFACT
jgi:transposase